MGTAASEGALEQRRALVFTDLVDSTEWVQRVGDQRAAAWWAEHDERARELLARFQGQEVDRSDGFFLLFDDVANAAEFAAAYHAVVASLGLQTRIGLHVGTVALRPNRPHHVAQGAKALEVDGIAKPIAARIMALCAGGRSLLTAEAAAALPPAAPAGHTLHRHGHYRLKGVTEPVEIFELTRHAAACEPPADTDKAYRVFLSDGLWRPARQVRHNIAPERDAFIGRQVELRELANRLESGGRLLTLMGPGGTGKTRLARRYALAWLGDWSGGVYFCDLSDARGLEGIHYAVSCALGVPLTRDDAGSQLGHAIAARGRCLVILDNFEHVVSFAAATVGHWLDRAAQASFVVTSRERLHIAGEDVFSLQPMDLEREAMALFEVRARAHKPGFVIDAAHRAQVGQIVRLLDGLPLAIELAAARMRILSPAQIVERLRDRFALLAGGQAPASRQVTLRAAIDWSWNLLAPWEQAALAQCSVFDGGFTLQAAEAVLDLSAHAGHAPTLDVVQSLVDKSLLRTWTPQSATRLDIAEPFFGMYLSIHEYAAQKLTAFGDALREHVEDRHCAFFARFGTDEAQAALFTHGGIVRRHALALEIDNLVTACRRALGKGSTRLAVETFLGAWAVLEAQGPFGVALALGRQVAALDDLTAHQRALVDMATATAMRTMGQGEAATGLLWQALTTARQSTDPLDAPLVQQHLAIAIHRHGNPAEAHRHFAAALAGFESLGHRARQGMLLANLANLQMEEGDTAAARDTYDAALALHRQVGNRAAEGITLGNLGTLLYDLGHHREAGVAYAQALAIHRDSGNLLQEAITLCNMGILCVHEGDAGQGLAHYRESLRIHREIGNRRGEGVVLGQIGEVHQHANEFEPAREHFEMALQIHREIGNQRFEAGTQANIAMLLAGHGEFDAALISLDASEQLLRRVNDMLTVAKLTCMKGEVYCRKGDLESARAALTQAQALARELAAQPDSEIGRGIQRLRRLLVVD